MMKRAAVRGGACAAGALAVLGSWAGTAGEARAASVARQSGAGPPAAFVRVCAKCHDSARIVEGRRLREQWEETLDKMVERGATGSDEDFEEILYYLLSEYGRVNVNAGPADDLALVLHLEPAEAEAIVRFRSEHGPFADFDALTKVPGVPVQSLRAARDAMLF